MVAKRPSCNAISQPASRPIVRHAYANRTQQDYDKLTKAKRAAGKTLAD